MSAVVETPVIETRGLRKEFGSRTAVAGLDLAVPAGGVHGFLGPNGSGKTTTIRMLLGLARPTAGTMRLFGTEVPARLPEVIDRVGAVVEAPKFLATFTGRQNLVILARTVGAEARVDAALETVGLTGRDRERYRGYSLGMKQRLAIAATLLKQPDLLILDEPTNGLDPAGIHEIRDTIRTLADAGVTVLLSSHILAEVQQVCTSATIIGQGRMLASGTVDDLLRGGSSGQRYRVGVRDPAAALPILSAAGLTAVAADDGLQVDGVTDPEEVVRLLAGHDLWVRELTPLRQDLESFFLELTRDDRLGGQAR